MSGTVVVVMGVSGCGKSTIAKLLAEHLGAHFRDGDELHPPENIRKMSDGVPLTDADREPWLEAVRDYAGRAAREHGRCVVACSALKRRVPRHAGCRRRQAGATTFHVFLQGSQELIASRMHLRTGHFMPEGHAREPVRGARVARSASPGSITVDITPEPEVIAAAAAEALRSHPDFALNGPRVTTCPMTESR